MIIEKGACAKENALFALLSDIAHAREEEVFDRYERIWAQNHSEDVYSKLMLSVSIKLLLKAEYASVLREVV